MKNRATNVARPDSSDPNQASIALKNATVRRGNYKVLESFDFSVRPGERVILAGKNGTGKTTLLKTILGLLPFESGSVEVLGLPVGSRRWLRQRRRLGYVDQESVQADLPVTAYEVCEIGVCRQAGSRKDKHTRVAAAMDLTGCTHLNQRLFSSLSGGEKQKVSLARCLSQQAEILVLDEPTSSLDPESRRDLMELLKTLNEDRGITVLMASHDPELLRQQDWRIYRMSDGRHLELKPADLRPLAFPLGRYERRASVREECGLSALEAFSYPPILRGFLVLMLAGSFFPLTGIFVLKLNLIPLRFTLMHGTLLGGAVALAVATAAALPAQEQPAEVIATTGWTAAFARMAGAESLRVLAPYEMRHPPEYELKPSDIQAVAAALGTEQEAARNLAALEAFFQSWKAELEALGLAAAPVLVHFHQRPLAAELGFSVQGVFDPGRWNRLSWWSWRGKRPG